MAGAFGMGAAYVVTGSVNQACVESGSSPAVRQLLAAAGMADVAMAPAADMFEMGVKVQVLKRGTMFPMRAHKLYDLYKSYPSWEAIPAADRVQVEKTLFRTGFDAVWADTQRFWAAREPGQLSRAEGRPATPDGPLLPLVLGPVQPVGQRRLRPAGSSTTRCGAGRAWGRSTSG